MPFVLLMLRIAGSSNGQARTTPGSVVELVGPTQDAFRRRDLRGPGALYEALPGGSCYLSLGEIADRARLSSRNRTIEWWLLILASQKWPLVDELITEAGCLWSRNELAAWQWSENVQHINAVAWMRGTLGLKSQKAMQLEHQLERAGRMFPLVRAA